MFQRRRGFGSFISGLRPGLHLLWLVRQASLPPLSPVSPPPLYQQLRGGEGPSWDQ